MCDLFHLMIKSDDLILCLHSFSCRRSLRRTTEENVCSLWMVLKAVTVTILLASVVTLGIVTYWSLQQIRDLKDQINTCESLAE